MKVASAAIAAIFIVLSCGSNSAYEQQNGAKVISMEPVIGNEQVVNLSEIATKVDYIPLQTSAESLVGEVMHLTLENDVVYIPHFRASKLSRFSISGEYLGSVGKRGRAFGEYTMLTGFPFDFDYETGIEMIFDLAKLIEYHPNGSIN